MGIEETQFIVTKTLRRSEFDHEVKRVPINLLEHIDNDNSSSSSSSSSLYDDLWDRSKIVVHDSDNDREQRAVSFPYGDKNYVFRNQFPIFLGQGTPLHG